MTVFDTQALQHQLNFVKNNKIEYFMGVDMHDTKVKAYCLLKKVDGEPDTLILAKSIKTGVSFNEVEKFKEEVKKLSEYFNATIVGEVNL